MREKNLLLEHPQYDEGTAAFRLALKHAFTLPNWDAARAHMREWQDRYDDAGAHDSDPRNYIIDALNSFFPDDPRGFDTHDSNDPRDIWDRPNKRMRDVFDALRVIFADSERRRIHQFGQYRYYAMIGVIKIGVVLTENGIMRGGAPAVNKADLDLVVADKCDEGVLHAAFVVAARRPYGADVLIDLIDAEVLANWLADETRVVHRDHEFYDIPTGLGFQRS
jgi:hypothetical protein